MDSPLDTPFCVVIQFGKLSTPVYFGSWFDCVHYTWENDNDYYCDFYISSNY